MTSSVSRGIHARLVNIYMKKTLKIILLILGVIILMKIFIWVYSWPPGQSKNSYSQVSLYSAAVE